MSSEILPEPSNTPQIPVTDAEAQAARLVTERLNEITRRAKYIRLRYRLILIAAGVSNLIYVSLSPRLFILFLPLDLIALHYASIAHSQDMPAFDADRMARLGGVKAIAPLFVALHSPLREKHEGVICDALTMLLPQMKASDAYLLAPAFRRIIHTWLNNAILLRGSNPKFEALYIAALKALEQVGDSSDIPYVVRVAKMKARTPEQEKIKQAAIECLPMLRANCGEVEAARTLLRASQSEDARPDTLLRPASGSGQTGSAELLRGSDSPDAAE